MMIVEAYTRKDERLQRRRMYLRDFIAGQCGERTAAKIRPQLLLENAIIARELAVIGEVHLRIVGGQLMIMDPDMDEEFFDKLIRTDNVMSLK